MQEQSETIYKEVDIEILISTMNKDSLDFLIPIFPFAHFSNFPILIVNQSQNETILASGYSNIRIINSFEKGLSKSRNLALEYAVGKILVIADDDVVYQQGFLSKIIASHNAYKDAAAITFSALQAEGTFLKKYPSRSKTKMNSFDILNTSSIEITLKKKIIDTLGVSFDENFGLGSTFEMGEEAILLFDLKKKNEQLVFIPEIIISHDFSTTSQKKSIFENYYIQGALFARIFNRNYQFWIFIKLFFDLKQGKIKIRSLYKIFKNAQKGYLNYKRVK
ncbi:glycosyltransferase family 2 protein [Flavobacterium sp.]|uniref:glycosyltransferase family 2 protein n=1 Tax=Flavobacterium sp. TaxID=239 RepID=UPI003D11F370